MNPEIEQLKTDLAKLQQDIKDMRDEYYRGNFSGNQDFTKYSTFYTQLKVPNYSSTPATCQKGEIIEVGGILYIASATNTWTKVGTQV